MFYIYRVAYKTKVLCLLFYFYLTLRIYIKNFYLLVCKRLHKSSVHFLGWWANVLWLMPDSLFMDSDFISLNILGYKNLNFITNRFSKTSLSLHQTSSLFSLDQTFFKREIFILFFASFVKRRSKKSADLSFFSSPNKLTFSSFPKSNKFEVI